MPRDTAAADVQTSVLSLKAIVDSPFNPRTVYDEQDLQELAASIAVDGVLEPVMVRRVGASWELVFGHRRVRAARLAGLTQVPGIVRDVDDVTAARMQIVENLNRKDLNALDQADGLLQLHTKHGLTVEQMAEQTGLSRSSVYDRLKLATLEPAGRKALLAGKLTPATAALVARVPAGAQQATALDKALETGYQSQPKSYRTLRAELLEHFSTSLTNAPFDTKDATLLEGISPTPIACTECPRRSGAAPDLFNDIVANDRDGLRYGHTKLGDNICTDPKCYEAKKKAHLDREAAALKAKGKTVITGAAARKAISAPSTFYGEGYGKQQVKGDFVALADVREEVKKAAKKGKDVETVVIQDPRTGRKVQAVRKEDLKAAGVKVQADKPRSNGGYDHAAHQREQQKKQERAAELTKEREATFDAIRQKLQVNDAFVWRIVLRGEVHWHPRAAQRITRARNCERPEEWHKWIAGATADDLQRAFLEYVLADHVDVDAWDVNQKEHGADLRNVAAHYGIEKAEAPSVGQQQAAAIAAGQKSKKRKSKAADAGDAAPKLEIDESKAWPFPPNKAPAAEPQEAAS